MVHADLRPELIGVPTKSNETFKLLDRLGDPSSPNQVQLNNLKAQKTVYMSPKLFNALMNRQSKVRHNPFKSDAFGLGMIILEAGLLESVQDIYIKGEKNIDDNCLVDKVEKFLQKYDQSLILQEIILIMLEFSEKLRQEPRKLLKTLRQLKELKSSKQFNTGNKEFSKKSIMQKIQICNDGFQMKNSQLVNLSYLYNTNYSTDQTISKENNLKRSLVEMLRNRNSHNQSKIGQIIEKLSAEDMEFEEEAISEEEHREIEDQFGNIIDNDTHKQEENDSKLKVRPSYKI